MYGKMLVLTFEDNEDDMMSHILSLINTREEIIQMSGLNNHLLNFKGLKIDEVQRVIIRENQEIELTYTEFEIFKLLAKHPGIVFSKEQIYDIVWKESYSGDYNIVMSHIRNIREKIEDNPKNRLIIDILILFFTLPTNLAVQFTILSRGYTGVSLKNRNKITLR